MIRLMVDEILKKKKKSVYWLYVNYFPSMGYTNLNNVVKNKTKRIGYDTLEKFSEALDVPVSELLRKIPNKE